MKVPLLCIKYLKNTPRFGYSFFITYLLKLGHLCHVKLKQAGMKAELHLPDLQFKDNTENHEVVKSLMLHGHDLDVEFSVDYRGLPLAIITTSGVKRFSYWLNHDSLEWLLGYLLHGEIEDFGIKPNKVDVRESLELPVFKRLVEGKTKIQYVPLLRETTGYVKALASCERGKIYFKLKRTPELLAYLKANNEPVHLLVG